MHVPPRQRRSHVSTSGASRATAARASTHVGVPATDDGDQVVPDQRGAVPGARAWPLPEHLRLLPVPRRCAGATSDQHVHLVEANVTVVAAEHNLHTRERGGRQGDAEHTRVSRCNASASRVEWLVCQRTILSPTAVALWYERGSGARPAMVGRLHCHRSAQYSPATSASVAAMQPSHKLGAAPRSRCKATGA